ncbi:hypothetical protein [Caballeronia sp. SBC2]|uniref:hypothetical protein n=1 Tax=Caballeronia sp. SBC2 TaxID=2705547 RepID=UPI0013E119F4|nr:hypothetical protein [Caballeronia sp. SBC2]QIE29670.1 hypothetical protein SBC2_77460 [Caballeronia sp. SBC2]
MAFSIDREEKVLAFRRVGTYDAYVTAGFPVSAIRSEWLAIHDCCNRNGGAIHCAVFLILFSLKRLRREESLWKRAEEEASMRASVGKQLRKAVLYGG